MYAGAKGKADPLKLKGYLLMPKYDGAYGEVATDEHGRIAQITLRSGRGLDTNLARDYLGIHIGARESTFAAELETHTQAANRHANLRGYRNLYLFDCLSLAGQSLAQVSFLERYGALQAIRAHAEGQSPDSLPTDASGRLHNSLGRFARDLPQGWRRWHVAPVAQVDELESCWRRWVALEKAGPAEGLVAINPQAKLGTGKLKLKRAITIDCCVVQVSPTRAVVSFQGQLFTVGSKGLTLTEGTMVEVAFCGGFYEQSLIPRFPRIVRRREDLEP